MQSQGRAQMTNNGPQAEVDSDAPFKGAGPRDQRPHPNGGSAGDSSRRGRGDRTHWAGSSDPGYHPPTAPFTHPRTRRDPTQPKSAGRAPDLHGGRAAVAFPATAPAATTATLCARAG